MALDGVVDLAVDGANRFGENGGTGSQRRPFASLESVCTLCVSPTTKERDQIFTFLGQIVDGEATAFGDSGERRGFTSDGYQHDRWIRRDVRGRQTEKAGGTLRPVRGDDRGADGSHAE